MTDYLWILPLAIGYFVSYGVDHRHGAWDCAREAVKQEWDPSRDGCLPKWNLHAGCSRANGIPGGMCRPARGRKPK